MDNTENKTYSGWDSLQITLVHQDKPQASIRMMRQDIEAMSNSHNVKQGDVINMMINALEDEWRQKNTETEKKEA